MGNLAKRSNWRELTECRARKRGIRVQCVYGIEWEELVGKKYSSDFYSPSKKSLLCKTLCWNSVMVKTVIMSLFSYVFCLTTFAFSCVFVKPRPFDFAVFLLLWNFWTSLWQLVITVYGQWGRKEESWVWGSLMLTRESGTSNTSNKKKWRQANTKRTTVYILKIMDWNWRSSSSFPFTWSQATYYIPNEMSLSCGF